MMIGDYYTVTTKASPQEQESLADALRLNNPSAFLEEDRAAKKPLGFVICSEGISPHTRVFEQKLVDDQGNIEIYRKAFPDHGDISMQMQTFLYSLDNYLERFSLVQNVRQGNIVIRGYQLTESGFGFTVYNTEVEAGSELVVTSTTIPASIIRFDISFSDITKGSFRVNLDYSQQAFNDCREQLQDLTISFSYSIMLKSK